MQEKTSMVTFENLPKTVQNLRDQNNEILQQIAELRASILNQQPKEYYTRREVADLLKIDLSTIHNWVKKGKFSKHCIGRRTYYKRSEVEKAITNINL